MATLTAEEIKKRFGANRKEVTEYLKKRKLPLDNKKLRRKVSNRIQASKIAHTPGKELTQMSPTAEWQIIYGRHRVGGVITYISASTDNQYLHLVVTAAAHYIDAIKELYLDGERVVFGAAPDPRWSTAIIREDGSSIDASHHVFMSINTGADGQLANGDLIAQRPTEWTADHKQSGQAGAYIILKWSPILFPDGLPNIEFVIRGKHVFDPATQTNIYTDNAVAIITDLLRNTRYGFGLEDSLFDLTNSGIFRSAYDYAGGLITNADGSQHIRYSINAAYRTSEDLRNTLESFTICMGGWVYSAEGKWRVEPGRWTEPVLALTEDDILSTINVRTATPRNERFNGVRGTHASPAQDWEEVEFPAYVNSAYAEEDGGAIYEDVDLPYVKTHEGCQRLGKLLVEKNRAGLTIDFIASLKAYQLLPKERFTITYDRLGWNAKTFRVTEVQCVIQQAEDGSPFYGVSISAQEDSAAVWDWVNGSEQGRELTPNTNLPSPFSVGQLQNIQLASGTDQLIVTTDGTIISRIKVSWDALDDFWVTQGGRIEAEYKETASSVWQPVTPVRADSQELFIGPVKDSAFYDVRIRSVNAAGIAGAWTQEQPYKVIGKTEPPSKVSFFTGELEDFGVRLRWEQIPDPDRDQYEIRLSEIGGSWEESRFLARVAGTSYFSQVELEGSYQFLLKSIDTSGNYSLEAAILTVSIRAPGEPITTARIEGEFVIFNWTEPQSFFALEEYEIWVAVVNDESSVQTFSNSNLFSSTKGTSFRVKVDWKGQRKFWIVARDVAGNRSLPFEVTVTIVPPGVPQNLRAEVVDNNVLLFWAQSTQGSLPISAYRILSGTTYRSATSKGEVQGTFEGLFESAAGIYTYWVVAYDSAGNISDPSSVTVQVNEPPDFRLIAEGVIDPREADVAQNIYVDGIGFVDEQENPPENTSKVGQPIGLLLAILEGDNQGGGGPTASGQPVGLLIAITEV